MESDETNMPPFIGLARPLSAQAEAMPAQEPQIPLGCKDCEATGVAHCAYPIECGGMKWGYDKPAQEPPDQTARIKVLEGLLQDIVDEASYHLEFSVSEEIVKHIRAVLEGKK